MCKDILNFSEGKKSVRSSGLLEYAITRDQFEPHVFYVWERYDSNASLGRHNSCTEYQAFMQNVSDTPSCWCSPSLVYLGMAVPGSCMLGNVISKLACLAVTDPGALGGSHRLGPI